MAVLAADEFRKFDAALDGLGLALAWEFPDAYQYQAPDAIVERQNIGDELTENKLDTLWWGSQRSWHVGAGQKRLNFPGLSSPYRFLESKGVDITEKAQATLLRPMDQVKALTNRSPVAPQKLAFTDHQIYGAAGQPNVARIAISGGTLVVRSDLGSGTETAQEILDMASDGRQVYLALGVDGIHRPAVVTPVTQEAFDSGAWTLTGTNLTQSFDTANKKQGTGSLKLSNVPAVTLEEAFDSVTGWSGTSAERLIDTSTKKEGTGALKVINNNVVTTQEDAFESQSGWADDTDVDSSLTSSYKQEGSYSLRLYTYDDAYGTDRGSSKTFTAKNFSAKTGFKIWVRPRYDRAANVCRIRLGSNSTNYFERKLPALTGGVWYEDVSTRATDWSAVGSPNWASISYIKLIGGPKSSTTSDYTYFDDFRSYIENPVTALVINKAFAKNFATKQGFRLWLRPDRTLNAGDVAIRMKVDANKYFERSLPTLTANTWLQDINVRTTDWLAVGGAVDGDWASIATLELVVGVVAAVWFDALESVSAAASGDAKKAHLKDYSSTAEFRLWLQPGVDVAAGEVTIRLEKTAAVYAERTVPALKKGIWYEDISTRSAWSYVGGFTDPDWALIAEIRVVLPSTMLSTLNLDDFRSIADEANFAHWSDWDARVIAWANDAIFAAGIKSGTQWRFFEAASGAGSVERKIVPDGWEVTDIVSLSGIVYFSAKRGNQGVIYAWDGEQAFIALDSEGIGLGDVPLVMIPFGGAGMLIGCLRSTGLPGGIGVLLRAFPSPDGYLMADELMTIGEADGKDYGVRAGFTWGKRAYFAWPLADATTTGLGVYMPEEGNGGYARHVFVEEADQVVAAGFFQGRRVISIEGKGIYAEDLTTYSSSSRLISSLIDLNIDSEKLFFRSEAAYDLPASTEVSVEYSVDGGTSWSEAGKSTDGSTRFTNLIKAFGDRIQYAIVIKGGSSTPIVYKAGIGGWPKKAPEAIHVLTLKAFPTQQLRSGEQRAGQSIGWNLLNELIKRRNTGGILEYQSPMWSISNEIVNVRIAGLDANWKPRGARQGGFIRLALKEVA